MLLKASEVEEATDASDTSRRFERNTLEKISGGGCVYAPCKPFTISDQNIPFPIPCPIEPDLKE